MSVIISTYGGVVGWYARKKFPRLSSWAFLKWQFLTRRRPTINYIEQRINGKLPSRPFNILIETMNRCNGSCAFCSASKGNETRPFAKMDDMLFKKILNDLHEMSFEGYVSLFCNNEPLLDAKYLERHKMLRQLVPQAKIKLITNGSLLTVERFTELAPYLDYVVINNYCTDMKLHRNIQELYRFLINNKEIHKNIEIRILIRYAGEVLTNRAGSSPNKAASKISIKEPCILPFTDFVIFPTGKVGLCCCDAKEVTVMGDINENSIMEIYEGKKYRYIRNILKEGRDGYMFCKHCDFVDSGLRLNTIKGKKNDKVSGKRNNKGYRKWFNYNN